MEELKGIDHNLDHDDMESIILELNDDQKRVFTTVTQALWKGEIGFLTMSQNSKKLI